MNILVSVPATEMFGFLPTLEDARELIEPYEKESVLRLLAKLSCSVRTWSPLGDSEVDLQIARSFFNKAAGLEYDPAQPVGRRFFTRVGILATANLALTACAGEREPNAVRDIQSILTCCLIMNDLVTSSTKATTSEEFLAHQLPYKNAEVAYDFVIDAMRSLAMFENYDSLSKDQPQMLDLDAEFQKATGLTARRFIEFCLITQTKWRAANPAPFAEGENLFIDSTFFRQTGLSETEIQGFLDIASNTTLGLTEFLTSRKSYSIADTVAFQRWPVIKSEQSDRYFCIDVAALMDKTGRGLYWTLYQAASDNIRGKLGGAYGRAFEAYLHSRVRRFLSEKNGYLTSLVFPNGDEFADAAFVEGDDLVICEYKSSVLLADAKCSTKPEVLFPEIEKKFVVGEPKHPKGVEQITRGIKRLIDGENIERLPKRKWARLRPVMVTLDATMTCPGMSAYLNSRFDRSKFSVEVAPLLIIDVGEYENLILDIAAHGFTVLLESYSREYFEPVHDQFYRFCRPNIPYLTDKPKLPDLAADEFREFMKALAVRVFGNQNPANKS